MNHKELTAAIRNDIKKAGIKAKVRMLEYCGSNVIQVNVPAFDDTFTESEQITIKTVAIGHGLNFVRGMKIDVMQNTNPQEFNFYM